MTPTVHCHHCHHRFGRRSRSVLLVGAAAFCQPCGDSIEVHRKVFFACRIEHTIRQHPGAQLATIGRARAALGYQNPD